MKKSLVLIFFLLAALVFAGSALADTRYVTDVLVITVRTGQGNEYQILETIRSATPVEVLEDGKTWMKVKTPKGTVGYALKQYLTSQPPKDAQIKELQAQVETLQQQLHNQQQNVATKLQTVEASEQKTVELSTELETARSKLAEVQQLYDELRKDSENVVTLADENQGLIEQNKNLNEEMAVLREENSNFHKTNMIQWFLAGAGVFLGGWIIGKISRKKQRGFSRF